MSMKNPAHPGSIVKGCIKELGLSVTDAAKVLGVGRPTFSKMINGRGGVSPEMAVRLSKAFGSTPEFWLRLQMQYELAQVQQKADSIKVERYQSSFNDETIQPTPA